MSKATGISKREMRIMLRRVIAQSELAVKAMADGQAKQGEEWRIEMLKAELKKRIDAYDAERLDRVLDADVNRPEAP
jgi:hypothetical protein